MSSVRHAQRQSSKRRSPRSTPLCSLYREGFTREGVRVIRTDFSGNYGGRRLSGMNGNGSSGAGGDGLGDTETRINGVRKTLRLGWTCRCYALTVSPGRPSTLPAPLRTPGTLVCAEAQPRAHAADRELVREKLEKDLEHKHAASSKGMRGTGPVRRARPIEGRGVSGAWPWSCTRWRCHTYRYTGIV